MKNFKLLLATTAILSTAVAMNVKADDEPSTTTLNVHVEIAVVDEIIPIQDVDFGTFVMSPSDIGQTFSVTMDAATGGVNYDGAKMLGSTKNGQVSLTMKKDALKKISLPNEIYLFNHEGKGLHFVPSSVQIGDTIEGSMNHVRKVYGIGGRLDTQGSGQYMEQKLYEGSFTGELTVTVIADEG